MQFSRDSNTLIQKLKTFNFKHISNSFYYKKYMKIGSIKKSREIFILLITNKTIKPINKNYLNLAKALNKLAIYTIKTEDSVILQKLHLSNLDIKALKKRNIKMLFNYARIDSVYNENTFKVLEFNARRPQMYEDADWISSKVHNHINTIKKEENIVQIIKSIKNYFRLQKCKPNIIILISDFNKEGNFSFNKELKNQFNKSKIIKINFSKIAKFYKLLKLEENGLYYKNNKINAFVIQSLGKGKKSFFNSMGGINNHKIKTAYLNKQIEISSPPSSLIFGRKQALELLQNKSIQKIIKLNKNEVEAVNNCAKNIPIKTIFKKKNLNNYVIKITGVGQGKGVFIGSTITSKVLGEIKNYLKQNTTKVILQKKVNPQPVNIYLLKDKKIEQAVIQLEPFLIMQKNGDIKISGYSSRAILCKDYKNTSKFNPAFNNKNILFGSIIKIK